MYYLLDIVGSYLLINLCFFFFSQSFYSQISINTIYSFFFSLSSSMETLQRAESSPPLLPGMISVKSTGWNLSILWKSG